MSFPSFSDFISFDERSKRDREGWIVNVYTDNLRLYLLESDGEQSSVPMFVCSVHLYDEKTKQFKLMHSKVASMRIPNECISDNSLSCILRDRESFDMWLDLPINLDYKIAWIIRELVK